MFKDQDLYVDFKTGVNYTYEYTCRYEIEHPVLRSKGDFSTIYLLRKDEEKSLKKFAYTLELLEVKNNSDLVLDEHFLLIQQKIFGKITFITDDHGFPCSIINYQQLRDSWIRNRDTLISKYHLNPYKDMIINLDKLLNNEESFTKLIFSEGVLNLIYPRITIANTPAIIDKTSEFTNSFRLVPGISVSINRYIETRNKDFTTNRIVKINDILIKCVINHELFKGLAPGLIKNHKLEDIDFVSGTSYEFNLHQDLKQIKKSIDFRILDQLKINSLEEFNLVNYI